MENEHINTISENNLNEELIRPPSIMQYKISLITTEGKLINSSLNFSNCLQVTFDNNLTLKIEYNDLIGFVREPINDPVSFSRDIDIIKVQERQNKTIAKINFFPYVNVRTCSFFSIFCCSCIKNNRVRKYKTVEILLDETVYEQILSEINNILYKQPTLKRKLLLFINPHGGRGNAMKIWNQVKNTFDLAGITIEVFLTRYYKHAYEHVLKTNLKEFNGILCCSGDGIVHEVVNALYHRNDDSISHTILGVIPGGSSNGLAKTLCEESKENFSPEVCAYLISKGQYKSIDILEIESRSSEKKIYSFLGIAYGLIADIDLNSEILRCIGHARFTLYGIKYVICPNKYYAKLSYLNSENDRILPGLRDELDERFITEDNDYSYFWVCNIPWPDANVNAAPKSKANDGMADIITMRGDVNGRVNMTKLLLNQDSGDYFDSNGRIRENSGVEYKKTKCFRLHPRRNRDSENPNENFNGFYSIDGERYPIEPINVKVIPSSLKLFCLNK